MNKAQGYILVSWQLLCSSNALLANTSLHGTRLILVSTAQHINYVSPSPKGSTVALLLKGVHENQKFKHRITSAIW